VSLFIIIAICFFLVEAILSKLRKYGNHDEISILMSLEIVILIALMLFDLGGKYIAGFWILVFMQNYINYSAFNFLLRSLKTPERKLLRKKTNFYCLAMNVLYIINLIMGFS
jgi:nucleoside permease NupC